MLGAARAWARLEAGKHPEVLAIGCFGSYARGTWGVGSDLDLLAIVSHCEGPFERRALGWKVEDLPVPAEILVYTIEEWDRLSGDKSRFARVLREDTQWLWSRDEVPSAVQVVPAN